MKFAFSTVACPDWDFPTVVARAAEYGYDGVELRAYDDDSLPSASNPVLSDPDKLRGLFAGAGVAIACLAPSIAMTGNRRRDVALSRAAVRHIDLARRLGCPLVKFFDTAVPPGRSRNSAMVALGDFLIPLADHAADHGILLVIENVLSFRSAKEIWALLDRLNHPALAAAFDLFNASLIGEHPSISVPTLNSKIQYTQVKDATFSALGASLCPLGQGVVPVQKFLTRLLGIGYTGYVTFEWERAYLPNIAPPEEALPQAIQKLREWTQPPAEEEPKKSTTKPGAKPTSDAAPAAAPPVPAAI